MRLGDKLKNNFAKNLQLLRTRNDLTQAKLVQELNSRYSDIELQRTSIVSYETEGSMPKMDALYCIADYFGKTMDQLVSPTMDKPVLRPSWLEERIAEPGMQVKGECGKTPLQIGEVEKSAEQAQEVNIDHLLTTCAEGIAYRQFYTEFLKSLYQQLLDNANKEEQAKVDNIFSKTFLGCLVSKSKYMRDTAENLLPEPEFSVFMAFSNKDADIQLVAKGLEMTKEEVIAAFNSAQTKLSSIMEGNFKSNLT